MCLVDTRLKGHKPRAGTERCLVEEGGEREGWLGGVRGWEESGLLGRGRRRKRFLSGSREGDLVNE